MRIALPIRRGRRARRRLRDDQDLLEALLQSASLLVVACAPDGRLTHASRGARELIAGSCPLDTGPEAWIAALRPRTPSGLPLAREDLPPIRALAGEAVRDVEVLISNGSREVLLSATASPVDDERGRRRGAVAIFEDITDQWRREARHRARSAEDASIS
jgi:PAS domain-containing protein